MLPIYLLTSALFNAMKAMEEDMEAVMKEMEQGNSDEKPPECKQS